MAAETPQRNARGTALLSRARLLAFLAGGAGLAYFARSAFGSVGSWRYNTVERPRPLFDFDAYRLTIDGLVARPLTLTYDELRALPAGWAFPSSAQPGPLTPAHVGKLVSRALADGWTCHTLRHRCGTVAYAGSKDLRAVQELLGHARTDTTALYTKVAEASIRAISRK